VCDGERAIPGGGIPGGRLGDLLRLIDGGTGAP
jgi:hypothetical protein